MSQETTIEDVAATSFWVATYRANESQRSDTLFHDRFDSLRRVGYSLLEKI